MDAFNAYMEQLINECNDVESLRTLANYWCLQDSPVFRLRLFQLEQRDHDVIEEQLDVLVTNMDAPPPSYEDDLEMAFQYVQEQDEIEETLRAYLFDEATIPSSPQPGPSNQQGGYNAPPSNTDAYDIKEKSRKTYASNAALEINYEVQFNNHWQGRKLVDLHDEVHNMMDDVLHQARGNLAGNDLGRVVIHHEALNNPIVIPLQKWDLLDANKVMDTVQNVLNSNEDLPLDQSFRVTVGTVNLPKGGHRLRITQLHGADNSIHRKNSMVEIVNDDQMCMARAIGVCWAKANTVTTEEWRTLVGDRGSRSTRELILLHRKVPQWFYITLRMKSRNEQRDFATALCKLAGVATDRPSSIDEIEAFENVLNVRIFVISASMRNKFIRVGNNDHDDRDSLYLYMVKEKGIFHYHAITNIVGFFSAIHFCTTCLKPYNQVESHRCATTCIVCKSTECPETDHPLTCRQCHMTCRSPSCYDRHLVEKADKDTDKVTSACLRWWKCTTCFKVVDRKYRCMTEIPHECGEWLCQCCEQWVKEGHLCYLRSKEPEMKDPKYVFFDFECRQDDVTECREGYAPPAPCDGCLVDARCSTCDRCANCRESWCGKQRHIPNYVVAHQCCSECIDVDLKPESKCYFCGTRCGECNHKDKTLGVYTQEPCDDTCGFRHVKFEGDDTTTTFGRWLFSVQHKGFTAVAHNMKGYDGIFLMEYLIENSIRPQNVIYSGSKIMYMYVASGLSIRVIDSLNFLPMRLAALPKAFDLKELSKGYFCHYFNTKKNQTYEGPYPETRFYGEATMSTDDRAKFLAWHAEKIKTNAVFNFREEMEAYCWSDVDILRRACLKFRALFLDATEKKIDPLQYITIAGVCMAVFKAMFLEEDYQVKLMDDKGDV
jgi:hypothetical protein